MPDLSATSNEDQHYALTTGFSGTNDNRSMLPLSISQGNLPALAHTNAEVLTYLLQQRNRNYVVAADAYGIRFSESTLLRTLRGMNIKILIDAGAQILELSNFDLVSLWLEIATEAPAAIYFDLESKPWVLYRGGRRVPLLASPYSILPTVLFISTKHMLGVQI